MDQHFISNGKKKQQKSFSVCFPIPFYVSAEWKTRLSQHWSFKFIYFLFLRISDFLFLTKIILDSFSNSCWTIIYIWTFYNINSPKSQLYISWNDCQVLIWFSSCSNSEITFDCGQWMITVFQWWVGINFLLQWLYPVTILFERHHTAMSGIFL